MPPADEKKTAESFYIDVFRPEDADGIVRLFLDVYGNHYPIRLFYSADEILAANRDGRYHSVVARTPEGRVIGVSHLYHSAPYQGLYESGVSLVSPEYRHSRAFSELLFYQADEYIPRNPHFEEMFVEAVCHHVFSQKLLTPFRMIETAIEVALMPAEAYTHEQKSAGRVATLDAFRCYVSRPHQVYMPRIYKEILEKIYSRLDDRRFLEEACGKLPAEKSSRLHMTIFDFACVARIAASQLGGDFEACVSRHEQEARSKNVKVFQIWLNLAEPGVGQAADILRSRGYFFGGVLPRWFDSDGLLMQKLESQPYFEDIVLLGDFPGELLDFIRQDSEHCFR